MNRKDVVALICDRIKIGQDEDIQLLGGDVLDSFDFVRLLVEVELEVNKRTGKDIVLQSRRAFSMSASPFRTVGTLADFIMELLKE